MSAATVAAVVKSITTQIVFAEGASARYARCIARIRCINQPFDISDIDTHIVEGRGGEQEARHGIDRSLINYAEYARISRARVRSCGARAKSNSQHLLPRATLVHRIYGDEVKIAHKPRRYALRIGYVNGVPDEFAANNSLLGESRRLSSSSLPPPPASSFTVNFPSRTALFAGVRARAKKRWSASRKYHPRPKIYEREARSPGRRRRVALER